MTKVLENTFRLINISFINEIAQYTRTIGLDIWEIINAAATKPYGFLAHYPGPGIGGECIPVLPYYLIEDARKNKVNLKITKIASKFNEILPTKIAKKAIEVVNGKLSTDGYIPKVMIIGIAYKRDVSDLRRSPALRIWDELEKSGITVSYHDPYVPHINGHASQKISPKVLNRHDLIIIATDHKNIEYGHLLKSKRPILDTRNVFRTNGHSRVIKI